MTAQAKNRIFTGQSILEYALIIGVVVAALGAMSVYVQRSAQANLKKIEDQISARATVATNTATSSQADKAKLIAAQAAVAEKLRLESEAEAIKLGLSQAETATIAGLIGDFKKALAGKPPDISNANNLISQLKAKQVNVSSYEAQVQGVIGPVKTALAEAIKAEDIAAAKALAKNLQSWKVENTLVAASVGEMSNIISKYKNDLDTAIIAQNVTAAQAAADKLKNWGVDTGDAQTKINDIINTAATKPSG